MKRSGASDHEQTRFKKKVQSQGESRSAKFKVKKRGGTKDGYPTFEIVARNIMVSVYCVPGVSLVVVRMVTK